MLRTVLCKCFPDRQGFLSRLSRETLSTKDKGSFPREKVFPGNSLEELLKTIKLFPALYLEMVYRQKADRRRGFFYNNQEDGEDKDEGTEKETRGCTGLTLLQCLKQQTPLVASKITKGICLHLNFLVSF